MERVHGRLPVVRAESGPRHSSPSTGEMLFTFTPDYSSGQQCVPAGGKSRLMRDVSCRFMRYYIVCVVTSHSPLRLWAHFGSSESQPSPPGGLCVRPLVL